VAIPCATCGNPVHESAVKCPHCGDLSGVPVDPEALAEARATAIDLPRDDEPLQNRVATAIVEAVSHAFDAAAELVKPDDPDNDPLPRATARDTSRARSSSVPTSGRDRR